MYQLLYLPEGIVKMKMNRLLQQTGTCLPEWYHLRRFSDLDVHHHNNLNSHYKTREYTHTKKCATLTNLHHHWFQRQQSALNALVHYGAAQ